MNQTIRWGSSGLILLEQSAAEGAGATPSFLALANIGQAIHTPRHYELHDELNLIIMKFIMDLIRTSLWSSLFHYEHRPGDTAGCDGREQRGASRRAA